MAKKLKTRRPFCGSVRYFCAGSKGESWNENPLDLMTNYRGVTCTPEAVHLLLRTILQIVEAHSYREAEFWRVHIECWQEGDGRVNGCALAGGVETSLLGAIPGLKSEMLALRVEAAKVYEITEKYKKDNKQVFGAGHTLEAAIEEGVVREEGADGLFYNLSDQLKGNVGRALLSHLQKQDCLEGGCGPGLRT